MGGGTLTATASVTGVGAVTAVAVVGKRSTATVTGTGAVTVSAVVGGALSVHVLVTDLREVTRTVTIVDLSRTVAVVEVRRSVTVTDLPTPSVVADVREVPRTYQLEEV